MLLKIKACQIEESMFFDGRYGYEGMHTDFACLLYSMIENRLKNEEVYTIFKVLANCHSVVVKVFSFFEIDNQYHLW